jgi:hypothetical protein
MNKHQAILATHSNVVSIRGDEAFDVDGNPVSYDESAVQAYIDANAYKEQRARAYPSFADQLDMLWHAIDSNTLDKESDFYTTLAEVKAKYAKGS